MMNHGNMILDMLQKSWGANLISRYLRNRIKYYGAFRELRDDTAINYPIFEKYLERIWNTRKCFSNLDSSLG